MADPDPESFVLEHAGDGARLVGDSRRLNEGDIFCALPGLISDGRDHIGDALGQGAAAVLWEAAGGSWDPGWEQPNLAVRGLRAQLGALANALYGSPSSGLAVIAVTGTKGKTTMGRWCAQLLRAAGMRTGYVGTLGAESGDGIMHTTGLTTPDVLELHHLLAHFAHEGCVAAVIETSSHALAQSRLDGVECDVAAFTNLGSDHLDYHASEEDYFEAKRRLFTRPELNAAVVNADDPRSSDLLSATGAKQLRCGRDRGCDLRWETLEQSEAGTRARLIRGRSELEFELPVPGEFNIANAALAAGAALSAGCSWEALPRGLAELDPVPGRLQRVDSPEVHAYVDYAHTPEALSAALEALRAAHPAARLRCVFGAGGERDRSKRRLMGEAAASGADQVVITNDNPRGEDPQAIADEVAAGCPQASIILDRRAAIDAAVAAAERGDVVLVAGKGHEGSIEFADGRRVPFDDAKELAAALEERER